MRFVVWIVLLAGLWGASADGDDDGRRGNTLYREGRYADAEAAYRKGLRALEDTTTATYAALQNNLGAALQQQKRFADARLAFDRAIRTAPSDAERARALFNAGNAAASMGTLEDALRYYRRALLVDPTHDAARHNFEVITRELAKRQEQQRGGRDRPQIEPSDNARRLKQQAEALVSRREYGAALTLMQEGLKRDSTVAAFEPFMQRIEDVQTIQQAPVQRDLRVE